MSRRSVPKVAIFLSLVILTGAFFHTQSNETIEKRKLFTIKQALNQPVDATFLDVKTYDLLNQTIEVYTWRRNTTLYQAILNEDYQVINTSTYPQIHKNVTMTPSLAELLAQQELIKETSYFPGHPNLKKPSFSYNTFRPKGPNWDVEWMLHSDNYTISNTDFEVRVYTETGETYVLGNDFSEITNIPQFDPPTITSSDAIVLAEKAFLASMDYSHVDSTRVRGLGISPPDDLFFDDPFRLYWTIIISGKGMEEGVPTKRSPVFHIDAHTGDVLSSYYISIGWDTINWKSSKHPYYGSVYPQLHDNTPKAYIYPLSNEEVWAFVTNHRNFRNPLLTNQSFDIDAYNWTNVPKDYSLEHVYLDSNWKGDPLLGVLWVKSENWVKTGAVYPLDNISIAEFYLKTLGGHLMVIDPITGEILRTEYGNEIEPPPNHLNITRDQAISIVEGSRKPREFIQPDNLLLAEPRIMLSTMENLFPLNPFFDEIYFANETAGTYQIYWKILYENLEYHQRGTYLVNAETGKLDFYVEYVPLEYKAKVICDQSFNNPLGSSHGVQSTFITPINDRFKVGRRNDTLFEYLETHSRYSVFLNEGDIVQYAFNSTHPINFNLIGPSLNNQTLQQGHGGMFKVEQSGKFAFDFKANPNIYANISFSLSLVDPLALEDFPNRFRKDLPINRSSCLGALTNYTLVLNCNLSSSIESKPILAKIKQPISEEKAEQIAMEVFGMDPPQLIQSTDTQLSAKSGDKELHFYGLDHVYFEGKRLYFRDWNESLVQQSADRFLQKVNELWGNYTNVDYSLRSIEPSSTSWSTYSGKSHRGIGVYYQLRYKDSLLFGKNAEFGLDFNPVNLSRATIKLPFLSEVQKQNASISPRQALDLFISGEAHTNLLGYCTDYGCIPPTGVCIIDGVDTGYYLDQGPHSTPYYIVHGRLISYEPEEDDIQTTTFHEYIQLDQ